MPLFWLLLLLFSFFSLQRAKSRYFYTKQWKTEKLLSFFLSLFSCKINVCLLLWEGHFCRKLASCFVVSLGPFKNGHCGPRDLKWSSVLSWHGLRPAQQRNRNRDCTAMFFFFFLFLFWLECLLLLLLLLLLFLLLLLLLLLLFFFFFFFFFFFCAQSSLAFDIVTCRD